MAIAVTNIGTNNNNSGSTLAISAVTVPAGSLIVVCVTDRSATAPGGSVSDGGTNTYASAASKNLNNSTSNGFGAIFYAYNSGALSGATLTYTKTGSVNCSMSAFYATGILSVSDPLDTGVTATSAGNGTGASGTVTSGAPAASGALFLGMIARAGNTATFTQDTGVAWATPPVEAKSGTASGDARTNGGTFVNTGTSALTYAPSYSGSSLNWAALIVAFKNGVITSSATASASAASTVSGVALTVKNSPASASAAASAAAVGTGINAAVGSASASATASSVGQGLGIFPGVGSASSTSSVDGVGASIASAVAAASSTASSSIVGASTASSTAASSSTSTDTGVGRSTAASTASASSTATDTAVGTGINASVGSASSLATDLGVGSAINAVVAAASSTSTDTAVGASTAASSAAASSVATSTSIGRSTAASTAAASSLATDLAVGTGINSAVGSASSLGTISGVGTGIRNSVGLASGTSVALSTGRSTAASIGSATTSASAVATGVAILPAADDPSFNGVVDARASSDYMSTDGGDYFDEVTKGTWCANWHKVGAKFTIAAIVYYNGGDFRILNNRSNLNEHGFSLGIASGDLILRRSNGNAVSNQDNTLKTGMSSGWYFIAVSVDESGGAAASHWRVGTNTGTFNGVSTLISTSAPSNKTRMFNTPAGSAPSPAGTKIHMVNAWDRNLSATEIQQLYTTWKATRFAGI